MQVLNYFYATPKKTIEFAELYKISPFCDDKKKQYPGNVIQYGFLELAKVETSRGHDGYSAGEWLEYKKTIFSVLCSLINEDTLQTFSKRDSATTLHRLALILSRENTFPVSNDFGDKISLLVTRLLYRIHETHPQAIANALWALVKLVENGKLLNLNATHLTDLVAGLHQQRAQANPQAIANTVWAVGKLVEAGKLSSLNVTHLSDLVAALHQQRAQAKLQNIANTVWALGKLVEADKLSSLNATHLTDLVAIMHRQRAQARPQEIAITVWACGIINKRFKLDLVLSEFIIDACHQLSDSKEISTMNQMVMGTYLLNLDNHPKIEPYLKDWISRCQPQSNLNLQEVEEWLKATNFFKSKIKAVSLESFISGYYVDVLVRLEHGSSCVIEIDGKHHQQFHQKVIDEYRDNYVLAPLDLRVIRIASSLFRQPCPFSFFKSSIVDHSSCMNEISDITKSNGPR